MRYRLFVCSDRFGDWSFIGTVL